MSKREMRHLALIAILATALTGAVLATPGSGILSSRDLARGEFEGSEHRVQGQGWTSAGSSRAKRAADRDAADRDWTGRADRFRRLAG